MKMKILLDESNKLCILIWLWVKSSCLACLQIMLLVYYLFIRSVFRVFLIMESVLGSQFGWVGCIAFSV